MKKFFLIAAAVTLLLSTYVASYMISEGKADNEAKEEARAVIKNEEYYFVKESDEKIGIYDTFGNEFMKLDVFTFTLPGNDRAMLKDGFPVTEDEVEWVVMDYTS